MWCVHVLLCCVAFSLVMLTLCADVCHVVCVDIAIIVLYA